MKKFIDINAIQIFEKDQKHYGAHQDWYVKKTHKISGCGPTTAALITKYMAAVFPQSCRALYAYDIPAGKEDFIRHMDDVRTYVKPGFMGLTNADYFASTTINYAKSKGVYLKATQVSPDEDEKNAFDMVKAAIDNKYIPALLILKNPTKLPDQFKWHWMAITGYDDAARTVFISTYAEEYELEWRDIWMQKKPFRTNCVYFYPA